MPRRVIRTHLMKHLAHEYEAIAAAREHAYALPLDDIDVSDRNLFATNTHGPYFERLRAEDPVHYHPQSKFGPYWSVTRHADMKSVDANHIQFSSQENITIHEQREDFPLPMFIAMDPPVHDAQRLTVTPAVAPRNLANLELTIRQRAAEILDELPVGAQFDWVDRVSIELTTQMLATLLDFPFEERRKLTRWSDVAGGGPQTGVVESHAQRQAELNECVEYFLRLRDERARQPPRFDLISMLAHGESTRDMPRQEFLGTLVLLIIGGNDTTRNSISGGVLALNEFPDQFAALRSNPALIPNMVSEIIRWQTPLPHMRRTATVDVELGGKRIQAGDKVIMWYVSGNRDERVFDQADQLKIDRTNARSHVSFGYGIHRCMGNRLAEMQLRVLWEEILARFKRIEVVGAPVRTQSNLIRGYTSLPVVLERI